MIIVLDFKFVAILVVIALLAILLWQMGLVLVAKFVGAVIAMAAMAFGFGWLFAKKKPF